MSDDGPDVRITGLASEQWGLVTSRQARIAADVTPQQLKRMADTGYLERLHHGIYRLARLPHDEYHHERVAWLALDPARLMWERLDDDVPTGVLSHRTAARMHQLGDLDADTVEITALRRHRLSIPDITIRRGSLNRDDWQVIEGLPVTTAVRTIADLATAGTDSGHLATVVRDALTRDLASVNGAASALAPHAFSYGHRVLDGQGFLDALIQEAGVPSSTLAMADIARRAASPDLYMSEHMKEIARSITSKVAYSPQLTASMNQIATAVSANMPPTDLELEEVQRVMAFVASQLPPPESFQEMMKAASAIQSNSEVLKLMCAWAAQGKESSR